MTDFNASLVLTAITAVDPRLPANIDPSTAAIRLRMWSTNLSEVDTGFAVDFVARWYQKPDARLITMGDIRSAWVNACTAAEARDRVNADDPNAVGSLLKRRPKWYDGYERACTDAGRFDRIPPNAPNQARLKREARSRVTAVPVPPPGTGHLTYPEAIETLANGPVPVTVGERERRSRACHLRHCACPHERCRQGWADDGDPAQVIDGIEYRTTNRCQTCADAIKMIGEVHLKRPY